MTPKRETRIRYAIVAITAPADYFVNDYPDEQTDAKADNETWDEIAKSIRLDGNHYYGFKAQLDEWYHEDGRVFEVNEKGERI
tara:strand:+ start:834 stop:1082 length:249 start_codon:yes stop_codon:yes gene_type:complete